jgi:L-ascorbate metabolism protein UlaG (beta-lactamase superfamily)
MIKSSLKNSALRQRAGQFTRLVRHSVITPRTGSTHKPQLVSPGQLGVTFIGHSSFFLQIGGQNVIIDPNFARWIFILKRLRQPGLNLRDLPPMDVVLVTHAHFDHLHRHSLRAIARQTRRQTGKAPTLVVPHHLFDLVSDLGYKEIIELEWWATHQHGSLDITAVPAKHWGARVIKDSHRGYGGYVVRSREHSVYHAGDTAYFAGFREIGDRLSPELALLPIGAYQPESYRTVHTSPADATRAFLDLKARWMIPMHYGSFKLSHEPIDEPLQFLEREAKAAGVKDKVIVLEEGVTRVF